MKMIPLLLLLVIAVPAFAEDGLERVDPKALFTGTKLSGRVPGVVFPAGRNPELVLAGSSGERHLFRAGFSKKVGAVTVTVEADGAEAIEAVHRRRALSLQQKEPIGDQSAADQELREKDAHFRAKSPGTSMLLGVEHEALVGLYWLTGSQWQPWQLHAYGLLDDSRVKAVSVTGGRNNQDGAQGVCVSFSDGQAELFRLFVTHMHYVTDRPSPVFKTTCGVHQGS